MVSLRVLMRNAYVALLEVGDDVLGVVVGHVIGLEVREEVLFIRLFFCWLSNRQNVQVDLLGFELFVQILLRLSFFRCVFIQIVSKFFLDLVFLDLSY